MAPHSSTLAWRIPWMEEPGRLQSMGSWRVGHDLATSLSLSLSCIGEGNGSPLQCSCLQNPMDRGTWRATVHGVAKSQAWLNDFTFTFKAKTMSWWVSDIMRRDRFLLPSLSLSLSAMRWLSENMANYRGSSPDTEPARILAFLTSRIGRK